VALPPGATTLGLAWVHPDDALTPGSVASVQGIRSASSRAVSVRPSDCERRLDAHPLAGSDSHLDGPAGPALGAQSAPHPGPAGLETRFSMPLPCDLFMQISVHVGAPWE